MEPARNQFIPQLLPTAAIVKDNPKCEVFQPMVMRYGSYNVTVVNYTDFKIVHIADRLFVDTIQVDPDGAILVNQQLSFFCLEEYPNLLCYNRIFPILDLSEVYFADISLPIPVFTIDSEDKIQKLSEEIHEKRVLKFRNDFQLILTGYKDQGSLFSENSIPKDIVRYIADIYAAIIKLDK